MQSDLCLRHNLGSFPLRHAYPLGEFAIVRCALRPISSQRPYRIPPTARRAQGAIHAAHKPTAATRPQIEPPPFCLWIAHPAQSECDGSTSKRKSTLPAKVAAQTMAPILTTPQNIFGGTAIFERHQEPGYDTLPTQYRMSAERVGMSPLCQSRRFVRDILTG